MAQYCSKCGIKIGFFSYKYQEVSDGNPIVLCKKCRQDIVEKSQEQFRPFQLSKGYTRIKATLFLQAWRIPTFCVICSSQEESLVKKMLSLNNGTVTTTIPIYSCHQCSKCNLDPSVYIRYKLNSNNLTLDIGNPDVAEKYLAFLTTELSNIKRNVLENPDKPVEFRMAGSGGSFKLPMSYLRDSVANLGVQEVSKIPSSDTDFQT